MTQRPSVVVTGAAGGIGTALVDAFEGAGWSVVSTDRTALSRSKHVVGDLARLANPESSEATDLIAALKELTGGNVRAVVHNAAHQVVKPAETLTVADWDATLSVNLLAPFWLTMVFSAELQANRGSVVAISSIHEKLTKPNFVAYATSKAAVSGMMRAMAVELGVHVRFNAICPAAIATPMLKAGFAGHADAYQQLETYHPVGRIGTPAEVASLALFLCSDAANFINGACMDMTGGIGARLHDPA